MKSISERLYGIFEKEKNYNSNGAVVDKNQYDRLSKDFAVNIRA